jgi:predicted outer membrane repeat protein
VITGCEFRANTAVFGGAIWYFPWTTVVITDCVFSQNVAEDGGAIACRFDSYPARHGSGKAGEPASVSGCTFDGNTALRGGALHLAHSDEINLAGCTLCGNAADQGSGIYLDDFIAVLERTIVSFGEEGEAICAYGGELNNDVTLTCCDLYSNAGGDWIGWIASQYGINGNFSGDPLFCNMPSSDLTIEDCSPCMPGNHPDGYDCGGVIGAWGSGCACGTGTVPSTWGALKSMYR